MKATRSDLASFIESSRCLMNSGVYMWTAKPRKLGLCQSRLAKLAEA